MNINLNQFDKSQHNVNNQIQMSNSNAKLIRERSNKDEFRSLIDIVNDNGFICQSFQVVTDDGYILSLYRIPGRHTLNTEETKPPVLLQHGLEADMMQWVGNFADVAPALVLARAGWDVWLGNNRGTRFSQKHVSMNPKSKEYWMFDWEDMGTKDLPAIIDFIIQMTG